MKLAISNIGWTKEEDLIMYNFLKENKISLEIAPTRIIEDAPYEHLKEARKIADDLKEKYNLSIVSMQSIWFGKKENIFDSEENYQILVDYTKKAILFAEAIGCPNLVFGSPKNRNMSNYEKNFPVALSFFKEIGEYALEHNVVIAVEPNPTIYNTNFLNTTKEAIDFVKKINLDSIKINYDFGTVIANNESLDILKDNINLINHIHISEPNLKLVEKRDIHLKLLQILKDTNYDKAISIEMKQNDLNKIENVLKYTIEILGEIYGNEKYKRSA